MRPASATDPAPGAPQPQDREDQDGAPEPVERPVGLETEYGALCPGAPRTHPVAVATRVVQAYAASSRRGLVGADGAAAPPVRWDYEGEDPLADLRGGRLDRAWAHPSQLTDDPSHPAPSGERGPAPVGEPGGARTRGEEGQGQPVRGTWSSRPRPSAQMATLPAATNLVLSNGARFYVDHAHPEYSSPEVLTPRQAVVWDRAGEVVAQRAMETLVRTGPEPPGPSGAPGQATVLSAKTRQAGGEVVLYKNNVDGKGASYGSHESYLVSREVPFADLAAALVPFLVTRPVYAGAGRVGIGQRSEVPGFQVSQRADYVESVHGLQTTFSRPIVNTRDEPHADAQRFRRLHVINGDANRFDVPVYLKVATTSLVLWLLERQTRLGQGLGRLADLQLVGDPVEEHWAFSHDTSLTHRLRTRGGLMTALDIQGDYLDAVRQALTEDLGGCDAGSVGRQTVEALDMWAEVLAALRRWARDRSGSAASLVEWVAKLELCQALRRRHGCGWEDPRLAALDIQWADLRQGRSVVDRLDAAGRVHRLASAEEVAAAADAPPRGTRAQARGLAVARYPQVVAASWTCLVLDLPGREGLLRLDLPGGVRADDGETLAILQAVGEEVAPGGDWEQAGARCLEEEPPPGRGRIRHGEETGT
ncbi:proteasome accessory factor PafA2 [Actinomyces sp. 2119]|nr:proteasome accessory factor PafA2 [Actinomyces sp. 2119]